MQFKEGFHLTYCSNIHPGESWKDTFAQIRQYAPKVKSELNSAATPFGIGLRLSNQASEELSQGSNLMDFKNWLDANGFYVFTLNGFPFGQFHGGRVKDMVHHPDWGTEERFTYTKRLFDQLAYLLPQGMEGGISTSPITYRFWYSDAASRSEIKKKAIGQLLELAAYLHQVHRETGKYLHLDLEPEPDGLMENTREVLEFFNEDLLPEGIPLFMKLFEVSYQQAREIILKHITICYDVCHFALVFEEVADTWTQWEASGIRIGKIQISAALRATMKDQEADALFKALEAFNEPVYLHQVQGRYKDQTFNFPDLPEFLEARPEFDEIRAHYHVPIFLESFGQLQSTQRQILQTLEYFKSHACCNHLEVETYTWEVLPGELKRPLEESISRELQWVINQFGE